MADTMSSFKDSYRPKIQLNPSDFTAWSSNHHYRTSSLDMSQKSPALNKTYAIPGYKGFIPGHSDSPLEKSLTWVSKEQLNRTVYLPTRTTENFPKRPDTSKKILGRVGGGLTDEYHTISRFHGKCTIPTTHPNYQDNSWTTSSRFSYVKQEDLRQRIYRRTSYSPTRAQKEHRPKTTASGFVQNSTFFDGHGWVPIEKLHGDMTVSEYRTRFNPEVPFHPRPLKSSIRKMRQKSLVY